MNIFLLFPTTRKEFKYLRFTMQRAVRSVMYRDYGPYLSSMPALKLHRWPNDHHIGTRRDLFHLWNAASEQVTPLFTPSLNFLQYDPIADRGSVVSGQFGTIEQVSTAVPPAARRRTLSDVIENHIFVRAAVPKLGARVSIWRPFYVDPPPWVAADSRVRILPVFYLSNNLTPEQEDRVRHLITHGRRILKSLWMSRMTVRSWVLSLKSPNIAFCHGRRLAKSTALWKTSGRSSGLFAQTIVRMSSSTAGSTYRRTVRD